MDTPQSLDGFQHDGSQHDGSQYQEGQYQEARYQAAREAAGPPGDYLQGLAALIRGRASVSAVFGDPVEAAGATIIPVARVRFALGGGLGRGDDLGEGGGGGGGAIAEPMGYIEIKNGTATYRSIYRPRAERAELLRPAAVIIVFVVGRRVRARLRRRVR
jgi:uncharacterized spore protein YtfJ